MKPMPGAIEGFKLLKRAFRYLHPPTAPWENPTAWHDKVVWVKRTWANRPTSA